MEFCPTTTYDYVKIMCTPRSLGEVGPTIHIARPKKSFHRFHQLGKVLLVLSIVGFTIPVAPKAVLETTYRVQQIKSSFTPRSLSEVGPTTINPVNQEFSLVIPKINLNSPIIPAVDPIHETDYAPALKTGIAHSSTSFFPDQNGTVYLFSHSTNYDWFVPRLNAAFYLLKNLEVKDQVFVFYRQHRYTYTITGQKIVNPSEVSYLVPSDKKSLILETCYPPGSIAQRLLIFADFTQDQVLKSD